VALFLGVAVRARGGDDESLRRSQRSGTLLVDRDSHAVIDLLPERTAAAVTAWLPRHPEIEVISRDRAGTSIPRRPGWACPSRRRWQTGLIWTKSVTEAPDHYLPRQRQQLRQAASLPLT